MMRFLSRIGKGTAWLIGLVVIVAAAGFGGRYVLDAAADDGVEATPLPVAVAVARYQDGYMQRRFFAGRITPAQVADAGFQVAGEVAEVLVQVGDRVAKDAPLARLDPVRVDLRRREAAAQLAEANAVRERADASFRRIEELVGQGFATAQELDDARADRNAARERVRLLERSLARVSEDADDAVLRSPFEGFVVARYVDGGATVTAGQPVIRINQKAALEAEIGVPTELAATLAPGDVFNLEADGTTVKGQVEGVGEDVDPLTRSRLVRLRISEDPGLVPGSLVRLALSQERPGRGVWVPLTALQEGYRGLWSVYTVSGREAEGTIVRKDVEIISLGDDQAFVTGTVEDGDRVVTSSTFRFVPGQKVEVVTEAPEDASSVAAASSTFH